MSGVLHIKREGAVAEVTLNRPEVLNALNRTLRAALVEAFTALSEDDNLRAIILTGAGRAFCAGVDLKELSADASGVDALSGPGLLEVMRVCPHPVIAAVNGHAVTGGLELALMCDFMIASQGAVFADTHARVGLNPGWGMSQILPRLIGPNRARQMSLTGNYIDAQVACDWGLVNEIVPAGSLMPRARELAQAMAETDARTMRSMRALIGASQEMGLSDGLAQEAEGFAARLAVATASEIGGNVGKVAARGRAQAQKKGTET